VHTKTSAAKPSFFAYSIQKCAGGGCGLLEGRFAPPDLPRLIGLADRSTELGARRSMGQTSQENGEQGLAQGAGLNTR
jgi:hypothetical protein